MLLTCDQLLTTGQRVNMYSNLLGHTVMTLHIVSSAAKRLQIHPLTSSSSYKPAVVIEQKITNQFNYSTVGQNLKIYIIENMKTVRVYKHGCKL